MKDHPRVEIVDNAKLELMKFLLVLQGKLTTGEYIKIISEELSNSIGTTAKYMIRKERHGNYEKCGDNA